MGSITACGLGGRHVGSLPFASCQVRHLDQLKYCAKVMGFELTVTNIPKVCLTVVCLLSVRGFVFRQEKSLCLYSNRFLLV